MSITQPVNLFAAIELITYPLLSMTCTANISIKPGITAAELNKSTPINWRSVNQLRLELANTILLEVGYNVDETLLFNRLCF